MPLAKAACASAESATTLGWVNLRQTEVLERVLGLSARKSIQSVFFTKAERARVLASDSRGREVILATLQPGDYIGEMSLIDNEPHSATVRAEVQTDVLMLGRSEFARCMPENSSMAYAVMRVLVQRLRHSVRNIESLALMDVYGRLARVLLENAERDTNGSLVIQDKISRLDLSKMVGASREMVTRVMKDLEQRGFVTVQLDGSMVIKEHLDTLV